MRILALDLATKTGWALIDDEGLFFGGTVHFKPDKKKNKQGKRYSDLQNFLSEVEGRFGKIDLVAYEDVKRHAGTIASHVYGGLKAHLFTWCDEREILYLGHGVEQIKKSFTGNGNASKLDMMCAAKKKGFHPVDDNHADAIALLLHTINENNKAT